MRTCEVQKIVELEKYLTDNYENPVIIVNNNNIFTILNEKSLKELKQENGLIKNENSSFIDRLRDKIKDYNELVLTAYDLLNQQNKSSLVSILQYCCITKDIEVTKITSAEQENKKYFTITVSKGNLVLCQGDWSQSTGTKANCIAPDKKIYKDIKSEKHIKLKFNIEVPNSILRELNLNSKKQVPMITTLQGFEPYNLIDMSNDEYIKQKVESDAKAIIYSERYKDHIKLLSNLSPYQAANAFLLLQSDINMSIQKCIHDILAQGNVLTVDSLIHYSFENIAEATRELFTKYHAFNTTDEEKLKITRLIALYFAVVEEAQNNVDEYIESMKKKYCLIENE